LIITGAFLHAPVMNFQIPGRERSNRVRAVIDLPVQQVTPWPHHPGNAFGNR
jgi:hypothetical protein